MALKSSTWGLLGATFGAAALMTSHAQASVASPEDLNTAMQAESYADLLSPIDNAAALLRTADMTSANQPGEGGSVQLAQYYHHHHHHHHHHFYHHHHHHHWWHRHWYHHWHHDY